MRNTFLWLSRVFSHTEFTYNLVIISSDRNRSSSGSYWFFKQQHARNGDNAGLAFRRIRLRSICMPKRRHRDNLYTWGGSKQGSREQVGNPRPSHCTCGHPQESAWNYKIQNYFHHTWSQKSRCQPVPQCWLAPDCNKQLHICLWSCCSSTELVRTWWRDPRRRSSPILQPSQHTLWGRLWPSRCLNWQWSTATHSGVKPSEPIARGMVFIWP